MRRVERGREETRNRMWRVRKEDEEEEAWTKSQYEEEDEEEYALGAAVDYTLTIADKPILRRVTER